MLEILAERDDKGKTRALLELVNIRATKFPGSRHLLLRKTRAALTDSVLVTLKDKVIPRGSPITQGLKRQFRHSYDYPNGSTIVCGGLDNAERTFSTEYETIPMHPEASEALCQLLTWQDKAMRRPMRVSIVGGEPIRNISWKVDHGTLQLDMNAARVERFDANGRDGNWHRWRKLAIHRWFTQVKDALDLDKVRKLARHRRLDQTLQFVGVQIEDLRAFATICPTFGASGEGDTP